MSTRNQGPDEIYARLIDSPYAVKGKDTTRRVGSRVVSLMMVPVVGGALGLGAVELKKAIDQPSHLQILKDQINKAKANPSDAPKGKYVWYEVGDNEGPSSIADKLAPGDGPDHAAIYDEVKAQEVPNPDGGGDYLPAGPVLVEVDRIHSNNQKLDTQLNQFNQ